MPCDCAHILPLQPYGSGAAATTVSRSLAPSNVAAARANSAVPSVLWSSATITDSRPG